MPDSSEAGFHHRPLRWEGILQMRRLKLRKANSLPKVINLMSTRVVAQIQIFGLQVHYSLNYFKVASLQRTSVQQINNRCFLSLCSADSPSLIIYAKNQINTITCVLCLSKQDVSAYRME